MKRWGHRMESAGGLLLFLAAMASDGGAVSLPVTCLLAGLAVAMMIAGLALTRNISRQPAPRPIWAAPEVRRPICESSFSADLSDPAGSPSRSA